MNRQSRREGWVLQYHRYTYSWVYKPPRRRRQKRSFVKQPNPLEEQIRRVILLRLGIAMVIMIIIGSAIWLLVY